MNNYVGEGKTINVTAPTGGLSAGDVVVRSSGTTGSCAVVITDIAAGQTGAAYIEGVFTLPKATGTGNGFNDGAIVYWDAGNAQCEPSTTGNTRLGRAYGAASASASTMQVKLGY